MGPRLALRHQLGYRTGLVNSFSCVYHQVPGTRGLVAEGQAAVPSPFSLTRHRIYAKWPVTDQQVMSYRAWMICFDDYCNDQIASGRPVPQQVFDRALKQLHHNFAGGHDIDRAIIPDCSWHRDAGQGPLVRAVAQHRRHPSDTGVLSACRRGHLGVSEWKHAFGEELNVWAVRLPGRESRLAEPALTDVAAVVNGLAASIDELPPGELIFFGHCLGALIAFELVHRLAGAEPPARLPSCLVVSAQAGPDLAVEAEEVPAADLSVEELVTRLRELGVARADALAHERLMRALAPTIRADLQLADGYVNLAGREPLGLPILAVGARSDRVTSDGQLRAWERCTTGAFRLRLLAGGHGYLDEHREAVFQLLRDELIGQPT